MDTEFSLKILLVGIVLICQELNASHFRGAIISWKPGSRQNEIIIDYRISWRMTYGSQFRCDDSIIQSGALVRAEGAVTCFEGCSGTLGDLSFQCTDYSTIEDWTSGKGRIVTTLNTANASFGFQGAAWISTLNVGADGSWKLRVSANLNVRRDTGTINSSPTAEITPIVRLQYGCNHTITIPVKDPDHDIVKCRWANDSNECADVCYAFPNAYLDTDMCTLTYDALYSLGWYAVAIQVEDFANPYDSSPLSSIPVQFLVQVYQSSDSCAVRPELIDPSPQNGDCIVVRKNETFETSITAHMGGYNRSIAEIKTISPLGMVKSPLMQINSTTWQVNVTWTPTAINDTSNVFCFTAKDTSGQQSEKRCITLLSGVSKPTFLDGYQRPTGMVSPDQRQWSVRVDRPFTPGSRYSYIRLYSERGSLLENIGSSNRKAYNHSLEFRTSTTLYENQTYYFLFDSGVVKSNSYCGTESDSEAIHDQYFWRFHTDKVPVRLVNGPNQYSGRVEVYHGGAWGTVCDDSFDRRDAEVICRMLGMLSNDSDIEAFQQAYFGQGIGRIVLDDLQCYGDESSIDQCRSSGWMHENCGHGEDAGVSCHTTVRLVNGTSMYSGRVEVYHNGEWGTICDDRFDRYEARVLCKQLGMYHGDSLTQVYSNAYFGEGNGSIALDDLDCNGYEQYIGDCRTKPWFSNDCSHSEDAGIDCNANEITTSPWWYNHVAETTEVQTPIRLVNGPTYYSGRVEIYHNGAWGTICDDDVDYDTVKVICKMLGFYIGNSYGEPYSSAHFGEGNGRILLDNLNCNGYESDITQCMTSYWYTNDCSHQEDAGVDCHGYRYGDITLPRYSGYYTSASYVTASSRRPWYLSTARYSLADAIQVSCNENGWNIRVNLALLRNIHPGSVSSDIYLGENSCTGVESWNTVTFHQGLHECLTSQMIRNNVLVYRNQLVYAQRDPVHSFIIRHYNWTIGVECDVDRNETSSGHIHHDTSSNPVDSVLGSSHYFVNMSFFSDPNFMYRIQGNPIHVAVGTKVYVKVYSTTSDWTIKMKVHTCYTKPTATASDHLKYEIIKNGCEMDSNTHIISQSSHETRFVFEDFEYTSNHEGLYVFCDAIFCRSSDYSRQCMQTCNP
ncbi:deleted in malignant brain tumors 1 protein-like [Mercenaria mercenaria]|uniref:deleted in malignant brain tumors 1 protein-like n=1 Tax=Mercenaria mercenaria TaxID=6596 RepID=UPI00234E883C|nr:deleted in malignant brain tumors 1 protein-like [Mercenaria mercenaria]